MGSWRLSGVLALSLAGSYLSAYGVATDLSVRLTQQLDGSSQISVAVGGDGPSGGLSKQISCYARLYWCFVADSC